MNDEIVKKLEQSITRRSFLRGSSLFAAGLIGVAAFPLTSSAQDQPRQDDKKQTPDDQKKDPGADQTGKNDDPNAKDEFKITRKDERGRDYRVCPQCGYNMYQQERTWTCENCGYSYTE
jgi:ribosomal protein S27AE